MREADNSGRPYASRELLLTVLCVAPIQALMALFVLASKDGWVQLMYTGLDAVGIDQQVTPPVRGRYDHCSSRCKLCNRFRSCIESPTTNQRTQTVHSD